MYWLGFLNTIMNFGGPLTSTEASRSGPNNVEPNPVLDPNASMNVDGEINGGLNLSKEQMGKMYWGCEIFSVR